MNLDKFFLGVDRETDKKLPFGLKYTRTVNSIMLVLFCFSFYSATVKSMFATYAQRLEAAGMGQNLSNFSYPIASSVLLFLLTILLPIILIKILNDRLVNLNKAARKIQIGVSFVSLLLTFPIGTIFYFGCLYFMLFDSKTKNAFL